MDKPKTTSYSVNANGGRTYSITVKATMKHTIQHMVQRILRSNISTIFTERKSQHQPITCLQQRQRRGMVVLGQMPIIQVIMTIGMEKTGVSFI